jgi:16S rRNA (guanine(527)-N(7))-methyltransferase RsmG
MSGRESFEAALRAGCRGFGQADDRLLGLLWEHYELMRRWNKAMSLTTVDAPDLAARRHYAESLIGAWTLPSGSFGIVDVGSGAGFPGWVVAAARPELSVHLVESQKKKAAFLREASDSLANVRVHAVRSEDFGERMEWVVSRAVRWQDPVELARRLGSSVCLWCSLDDAAAVARQADWNWRDPLVLPGAGRSCILVGRCLA